MTNTKELRKLIEKCGIKYAYICKELGVTYATLRSKINNKSDFSSTEIATLCKLLCIGDLAQKEYIFFAHDVE